MKSASNRDYVAFSDDLARYKLIRRKSGLTLANVLLQAGITDVLFQQLLCLRLPTQALEVLFDQLFGIGCCGIHKSLLKVSGLDQILGVTLGSSDHRRCTKNETGIKRRLPFR